MSNNCKVHHDSPPKLNRCCQNVIVFCEILMPKDKGAFQAKALYCHPASIALLWDIPEAPKPSKLHESNLSDQ
jgi:hypothetical protein